jgi:hypothetical protein
VHKAEQLPADSGDAGPLLHPPYWFVHALPWPGGHLAEGAIAYAPIMIPREGLTRDAQQILACADLIAERRHARIVLFSDITRILARASTSWQQLGVDWEHGLHELDNGHFPALYLTISERAYAFVSSPTDRLFMPSADRGLNAAGADERNLVRESLAQRLGADWPLFMKSVISA